MAGILATGRGRRAFDVGPHLPRDLLYLRRLAPFYSFYRDGGCQLLPQVRPRATVMRSSFSFERAVMRRAAITRLAVAYGVADQDCCGRFKARGPRKIFTFSAAAFHFPASHFQALCGKSRAAITAWRSMLRRWLRAVPGALCDRLAR